MTDEYDEAALDEAEIAFAIKSVMGRNFWQDAFIAALEMYLDKAGLKMVPRGKDD